MVTACLHWLFFFPFPSLFVLLYLCVVHAQRRRNEWSRVQTGKEPVARSRTAQPAWVAWREEVSHPSSHLCLPLAVPIEQLYPRGGGKMARHPLVRGWLTLRLRVSWLQPGFGRLFFLTGIITVSSQWYFLKGLWVMIISLINLKTLSSLPVL